jgi:hypothetical protein
LCRFYRVGADVTGTCCILCGSVCVRDGHTQWRQRNVGDLGQVCWCVLLSSRGCVSFSLPLQHYQRLLCTHQGRAQGHVGPCVDPFAQGTCCCLPVPSPRNFLVLVKSQSANVGSYHPQLSYCMVLYASKDHTLTREVGDSWSPSVCGSVRAYYPVFSSPDYHGDAEVLAE